MALVLNAEEQWIEAKIAEYRDEMLSAMNRYHGCDRYKNENSCLADAKRVDSVIMPVVRKMLEDASEAFSSWSSIVEEALNEAEEYVDLDLHFGGDR